MLRYICKKGEGYIPQSNYLCFEGMVRIWNGMEYTVEGEDPSHPRQKCSQKYIFALNSIEKIFSIFT